MFVFDSERISSTPSLPHLMSLSIRLQRPLTSRAAAVVQAGEEAHEWIEENENYVETKEKSPVLGPEENEQILLGHTFAPAHCFVLLPIFLLTTKVVHLVNRRAPQQDAFEQTRPASHQKKNQMLTQFIGIRRGQHKFTTLGKFRNVQLQPLNVKFHSDCVIYANKPPPVATIVIRKP